MRTVNYVYVDGQQINSSVGAVTTVAGSVVELVGVSMVASVGDILVWGEIDTSQDPNYNSINTTQSPGYSTIDTSQSAGYEEIKAGRDAA